MKTTEIKFGLYEVDQDPCGCGLPERHELQAISEDENKLKEFCKANFGKEPGKPEKFSWDNYFIIKPFVTKLV